METTTFDGTDELLARFRSALRHQRSVLLRAHGARGGGALDFARSVAAGLDRQPRALESRFLYDARGSVLYDQICAQPEYYPARLEASILRRHADLIARLTGPVTVVELGSGSSTKTGPLLAAYHRGVTPVRYVPIDVSDTALWEAGERLAAADRLVQTIGVHGVYADALPLLSHTSPLLVLFLGGTLGNMGRQESRWFWSAMAEHMRPGDFFLLGVDLIKSPEVIEAAYNDAAGVTAAFTRNLFVRMNRELGSRLDVDCVEHEARYVPERRRVEICARFSRDQEIAVPAVGRRFVVRRGERIQTEISRKYRLGELGANLERHGFRLRRVFTDAQGWFATLLLCRVAE